MHVNKKMKTENGAQATSMDGIDDRKKKALDVAAKLAELAGISSSYRKNKLHEKRVYAPPNQKHINWVGLLMGPQGLTMRSLQAETGCRFRFKGKGSSKSGRDEDGNSELYVLVTAEGADKLSDGVKRVERIFYDDEYRAQLQSQQNQEASGGLPGVGRRAEVYIIPSDKVGLVIGKGGSMIVKIQQLSGCQLQVDREPDPDDLTRRKLYLCGTEDQLKKAKIHIDDVVAGFRPEGPGEITKYECVPQRMIGRVIGKGGETIRRLEQEHACMVKVLPGPPNNDDNDAEVIREVMLRGFPENVASVSYEVQQLTDFSGAHMSREMAKRQQAQAMGLPVNDPSAFGPPPTPQPTKVFIQVRVPENRVARLLTNTAEALQTIERENDVSITLVPIPTAMGLRNLTICGLESDIKKAKTKLDEVLETTLPSVDIMESGVWKPGPEYAKYTEVFNNQMYYTQTPAKDVQQQQYPGYQQVVGPNGQVQYVPQQQYFDPQYAHYQQYYAQQYQQQPQPQQMQPPQQQPPQQQPPQQQQQQQPPRQYEQPPNQTAQQATTPPPPQAEPEKKKLTVQEQIAAMKAKVAAQKAAKEMHAKSSQILGGTGQGQVVEHKLANGQVIHQLPNGEIIQLAPGQELQFVEGVEGESISEDQIKSLELLS